MTRRTPPSTLKRLALPIWNAAHHLAGRLGRAGRAALSGSWGRCEVCGRPTLFVLDRRVMPAELVRRWGIGPAVAGAFTRKESLACLACGSTLRARRLARTLVETFPAGDPGRSASSLAEWVASPEARRLRVAEINRVEGLHGWLARLPGLAYSEFLEGAEPGATVDGVRREDLTRLSYPDAAFDLVITSETLEHVPDLDAALREVRRVLVPGGWHLFTVPVVPGVPATFARATLNPDGSVEHRATPICHPGGDRGWPVFHEFGADLAGLVAAAGFRVDERFGPNREADVAQVYRAQRPATATPIEDAR